MDADPKGEKCPAIDGILKEGKELMGEIDDEDVMNVGLVAAAQAVEHYEITRYGALSRGRPSRPDRRDPHLKANLAEEKATDQKLTAMAERRFNPQAEETGEEGGEEEHRAPQGAKRARREGEACQREKDQAAGLGLITASCDF